MTADPATPSLGRDRRRGSVLIIVLWICLGLVTLTLYFAHEVNSELQAAANRVGEIEARQAVAGAIRYAAYVLNNYAIDGVVPDSGIPPDPVQDYYSAGLQVGDVPGDPQFWFIGRDPNDVGTPPLTQPVFSLVDEASKLNLNTATTGMLTNLCTTILPTTDDTADLVSAIVSWRTRQGQAGSGAANSLYSTLDPARVNKGAIFETTDELRLVYGATLDILLGEDTNRNGALDPNEDDGDQSPPHDNQDGQLQPGLLEYVTAFSNQPTTTITGGTRVDVTNAGSRQRLMALMTRKGISGGNARTYMQRIGATVCNSVAQFMVQSRMSAADFALIHTSIYVAPPAAFNKVEGLVNVNTASETVLSCLPGISPAVAASMVAYRQANPEALTSFAWLQNVPLGNNVIRTIGPYITDQSYQFSADIAAVGRNGRGYCREKVVFDTSKIIPRIIYRQDLSSYGWALGSQLRQTLKTARIN